MSELEQTQDTDVVRCIEYAIVDPLLFASVLISAAPSVPTGIVQLCYATMMGFHLLCIPLLRIGAISGSIDNGNVMKQAAQEVCVPRFISTDSGTVMKQEA